DLPIKRISEHARREKSIRHGHISTLHIWWARRPLAACRAVICAALWPDPADSRCHIEFGEKTRKEMLAWTSHERQQLLLVTVQLSVFSFALRQQEEGHSCISSSLSSLQPCLAQGGNMSLQDCRIFDRLSLPVHLQ